MAMLGGCSKQLGWVSCLQQHWTCQLHHPCRAQHFLAGGNLLTIQVVMAGCTAGACHADVGSRLVQPLVAASVEVYLQSSCTLLPTPAKSHYTFNLRDMSRVFQVRGLM
jgi:AAA+ lid domain